MTQAEQASLEALRTSVESGFSEMRVLMEARRIEEVRVAGELAGRIQRLEQRRSVADAFTSAAKYIVALVAACASAIVAWFLH